MTQDDGVAFEFKTTPSANSTTREIVRLNPDTIQWRSNFEEGQMPYLLYWRL